MVAEVREVVVVPPAAPGSAVPSRRGVKRGSGMERADPATAMPAPAATVPTSTTAAAAAAATAMADFRHQAFGRSFHQSRSARTDRRHRLRTLVGRERHGKYRRRGEAQGTDASGSGKRNPFHA
jgi:hypothetical protein